MEEEKRGKGKPGYRGYAHAFYIRGGVGVHNLVPRDCVPKTRAGSGDELAVLTAGMVQCVSCSLQFS